MADTEGYELVHIFAGLPKTVRGKPINVNIDPKGKNILYCNGNFVFIRDVENPINCDVYTEHAKETTVACYAPSGNYICSGDVSGKIRIWDTINKEHILKYEYTPMSGAIKDIAWTEDSKRIAVCGEGRDKFAHAIMWDTGTGVGSLTGQTKSCNSVSIKQDRPYRLILGSEDYSCAFFEGPPFKFKSQTAEHSNFVNCVRFSHDGTKFATTSADGRCFVYEGKSGDLIGELNAPMQKIHKGGVYAIAWSPDNKFLLSCSADKTVKVWTLNENDFSSNKEKAVFNVGSDLMDMQVGCNWIGNYIFSVSLSGFINYWDMENPSAPTRVIKGHNKAIISSTLSEDRKYMFTASFDGLICYWDIATGVADVVEGKRHSNQVQRMSTNGNMIYTCGMDDTVKFIDVDTKKYCEEALKMESQPQGIAAAPGNIAVVACTTGLVVIKDRAVVGTVKTQYEPSCVDVNADGSKVAVGGQDSKVRIYNLSNTDLKESELFPCNGNVTDVKFSPDGFMIACCTGKKQVKVVSANDVKTEKCNWASHATKVNGLNWTPDSLYLASCGVDGVVYTWNVTTHEKERRMQGAHSQSCDVTSVQWADNNKLLTTGRQDCSVRVWNITH